MSAPDRYVVVGNPIKHSKSPDIHARFAQQTGQHLVYERLLAPLDGFVQTMHAFVAAGGKGANVTVPFKLDAYNYADVLSDRAKAAGAVNTLKMEGSTILGDNTDGVGLVTDIVQNAQVSLRGKRILLLGAGGAARGVVLPLLMEQPAELFIANRTSAKAVELARHFSKQGSVVQACEFAAIDRPFDIIINATSASLAAEVPAVPALAFNRQTLAYDMMYAKEPTPFLQFASGQGAMIRDGLGMLVEQAAESFFIWRGMRPDTSPVYQELRSLL